MDNIMDDPRMAPYLETTPKRDRLLCPKCPKVGRTGAEQRFKEPGGGYCKECRQEYQKQRNLRIRKEIEGIEEARSFALALPSMLELAHTDNAKFDAEKTETKRREKYWADLDAELLASGNYMQTPEGLVMKTIANGGLLAE